jgi:hypothetical protein
MFLRQGWYGLGIDTDGRGAGAVRLVTILRGLLDDPAAQARLGDYGRTLVVERFNLSRAAAIQEEIYLSAIAASSRLQYIRLAPDAVRTGIGLFKYKAARRWRRWRHTVAVDDFNMIVRNSRELR